MTKIPCSWMVSSRERIGRKYANGVVGKVPHLPPPNVHSPNGLFLPTNPECLVKRVDAPDVCNLRGLQAVKGVQSLNIELSWRFVLYVVKKTFYPLPCRYFAQQTLQLDKAYSHARRVGTGLFKPWRRPGPSSWPLYDRRLGANCKPG